MSTAQLAEDEWPARTALKGAQERLAKALAAGEAAAQSLARGREKLAELERRQDAVKAEVANELLRNPETLWRHESYRRSIRRRVAARAIQQA
jgi:hypothetical protein